MSYLNRIMSLFAVLFFVLAAPRAFASDVHATVNVAFVTDLSGSMKSNNLVEPTQGFLGEFFNELYIGDRVILVDFGSEIRVNNPVNISERNKPLDTGQLKAIVGGYSFDQANTYTSGALQAACSALGGQIGPKVLVLLTDGIEEIPPGFTPKWDTLSADCQGIAIHVVALTAQSKPTVAQIGTRLGAKIHDATVKSLADIGQDIRAGIRVFVSTEVRNVDLGNLTVGSAGEIRAEFAVQGASNQIVLEPYGDFPDGVELTCPGPSFAAPGDLRCQLRLVKEINPGSYSGTFKLRPAQGDLAVVTPEIEIKFSRGLLNVQVSEDDISLGALRPSVPTTVILDFEANETAAPQPVTLSLSGFPDGMVTLEPSQIMAPAVDVELRFTFVNGGPGSYSGQLILASQTPTMQVQPAVIPLSFTRRTWFWENWKFTVPSCVLGVLLILVGYHRLVRLPRERKRSRPLLKGRLIRPDDSEVKLDPKLQTETTLDGLTFTALGTRERTRITVQASSAIRIRFPDGAERYTAPDRPINLVDRAVICASDGTEIGTFRLLGLRR